MVWPEFRKLRRALTTTKRANQRKKGKEKSTKGESGLQQVHPGELVGGSGWLGSNSVEEAGHKVVCSDKGVQLLLKDGSWSSDDNTCDRTHVPNKVDLERQVAELRLQLVEERQNTNREHSQEARDGLKQDLERERSLRFQAESHLQEARAESESCRERLSALQRDLNEMEEMVQSGTKLKSEMERLQEEKLSLVQSYRSQLHKYQSCVTSLQKENLMLLNHIKSLQTLSQEGQESWLNRMLLERVRLLEQENSALVLENEQQRLQYEWCLDDVGRQVVRALVAQKGLQEECMQLQRRVRDLEGHNLALTTTLLTQEQQAVKLRDQENQLLLEARSFDVSRFGRKASRSQDSGDSLASFCNDFSFLPSSGIEQPQPPGCAKMSSPPQWLHSDSCRSSWTSNYGFLPFHRLPSPLLETDPRLRSHPPSSSDNLDSLETPPSDDSLWWLSSSPQASPVAARPTTLDLAPSQLPHSLCDFDFSALEKRDGVCSNIYEEVDLPGFPGNDSPIEVPTYTNTVVRRSSVPAAVLPPPLPSDGCRPFNTSQEQTQTNLEASVVESPLSLGGGKDEGYSTMSSDVQCDVPPPSATVRRATVPPPVLNLCQESCSLLNSPKVMQEVTWDSNVIHGASPPFHRFSSLSEPSCGSEVTVQTTHHRSSLDPSYNKIFKLFTPLGFNKIASVQRVSGKFQLQTNPECSNAEVILETVVREPEKTAAAEPTPCAVQSGSTSKPVQKEGPSLHASITELQCLSLCQTDFSKGVHRTLSDSVLYCGLNAESCCRKWSSLPSNCKYLSADDVTVPIAFHLPSELSQASGSLSARSRSMASVGEGDCSVLEQEAFSDDDPENRTLVEQWLEARTTRQSQNVYVYDEEEIGNWSLDLSDVNQGQWEDQCWATPLSKDGPEEIRLGKEDPLDKETRGEVLQVEFNSDFYRLCSVGSVRSLHHVEPDTPPANCKKVPDERVRPQRKERTRIPVCTKKTSSAFKDKKKIPVSRERRSVMSDVCRREIALVSAEDERISEESGAREMVLDAGLTVADKIRHLTALLANSPAEEELPVACPRQSRIPRGSPEKRTHQQRRGQAVRRQKEGCGTSWVHFEADVDLSDPKARANLLDSMMASSSSSSEGEDGDQVVEHQHNQRLHALHRFRRHRKRVATDPGEVISYLPPRLRASIVDRRDFFFRFGEKEREAVACFDFLDELSTSPSDAEGKRTDDRISLSDSCAESFSSSTQSLH